MQIGVSNPNVPKFLPRVCTLVLFIIVVTVVVPHVCVCVFACSQFLPPRAFRPRNIGLTYVFSAARKIILYNYYNRDFVCCKCFVQKLRRHLLASNTTNYS